MSGLDLDGYTSAIEIMELLTRENETIISLNHPDQFESINNLFEKYGDKIAGVVTGSEQPVTSFDLEQVSQVCKFIIVLDCRIQQWRLLKMRKFVVMQILLSIA